MTIEIHNIELVSILQQRLRTGRFTSVEEMLLETFKGTPSLTEVSIEDRKAKAFEAASRIRELRKGVTLDRPEGMSLRDFAHIGHRY